MQEDQFDIAIVGAGIVGCMMAGLLTKSTPRLKIALIDEQVPPAFDANSPIDSRVYAINLKAKSLLETLELWDQVDAGRCCAYQNMKVWEDEQGDALDFSAGDVGTDELGYIVEHKLLHSLLYQRASENVELVKAKVDTLLFEQHSVRVQANEQSLRAKLLIAADGAHSGIRALTDVPAQKSSYLQTAIVANVKTANPHLDTAYQRFLESGPLAFLPLANGESSIVWSLPNTECEAMLALEDSEFINQLKQAFQGQLGSIQSLSKRQSFPLSQLALDDCVKPRLAFIGDAAHVVHPLAGQGLNLGFNDVYELHQVLEAALKAGQDYGQLHILKRYQRKCLGFNKLMMEAYGLLNNAFMQKSAGLSAVRRFGMSKIQRLGVLKKILIEQAIAKI